MKLAKELQIVSRDVNICLKTIVKIRDVTLNTGYDINPETIKDTFSSNDTKTIKNNLIQSLYIDSLFFESDRTALAKDFSINKLIYVDNNRFKLKKCNSSTTITKFTTNNLRTDQVENFGFYSSRGKKHEFKSFNKLLTDQENTDQEKYIKEFYTCVTSTEKKINSIKDSLVFLWDMFICEYTRNTSVLFTFPICLKISYYIINNAKTDNIDVQNKVKKFFNSNYCAELFFTKEEYQDKLKKCNDRKAQKKKNHRRKSC